MGSFEIRDDFYLDGEKFKIISGAIHYFRVRPEYWRDRLEKLKYFGCNTVETYIPWNFHEPEKGHFLWDGDRDFVSFIEIAESLGLYIIIRPSPFICAEWEFGGLPYWLLRDDDMKVRSSYGPYLEHVKDYYNQLIPRLVPHQIDRGGKIILVQIENEYGYFGRDKKYLHFLADCLRQNGITVPFVTSDGPWGWALKNGSIPEALPTANFGSKAVMQFGALRRKGRKNGPLMCMEFWAGWFDAWGNGGHKKSNLEQNKKDLIYMLENGNVNFYMFHGGTNFGFMNGSNYYTKLTPDTTSYDYDAVLSECGDITEKYKVLHDVVKLYNPSLVKEEVRLSTKIEKKSFGKIPLCKATGLFENLDKLSAPSASENPLSMEKLGVGSGYVLYKTNLDCGDGDKAKIKFSSANDRLIGFYDSKKVLQKVFTLFDREIARGVSFSLENPADSSPSSDGGKAGTCEKSLYILAENLGRVNFGGRIKKQQKGITGDVKINGKCRKDWQAYPLAFDSAQMEKIDFNAGHTKGLPGFYLFEFDYKQEVDIYVDTFLDFSGWGKGFAYINGFNLGRYWNIGPQKRLYIPGPLLKKGKNTIILFESEGITSDSIELCDAPYLG